MNELSGTCLNNILKWLKKDYFVLYQCCQVNSSWFESSARFLYEQPWRIFDQIQTNPDELFRFEKLLKLLLDRIETTQRQGHKRKRADFQRLKPRRLLGRATRVMRRHLTSCISISVDSFTSVNDKPGHQSTSTPRKEQNYPSMVKKMDLRWLQEGLQYVDPSQFCAYKILPEMFIEKLLHRIWIPFRDKYSSSLEKLSCGVSIPLDQIFTSNTKYSMLSYLDLKMMNFDMEHAAIIAKSCRLLEGIKINSCISISDLGLAKVLANQQLDSFRELIIECPEPLSVSHTINTLHCFHRTSLATLVLGFDLFSLPCTPKNTSAIEMLGEFVNLRRLELRGCPSANDRSMKKAIEACPLSKVTLDRTAITHSTIEALARNSGKQLRELRFGTSDKRLGHIVPMLATHCPNIQILESLK